jgi:hypothetical protein
MTLLFLNSFTNVKEETLVISNICINITLSIYI